MTKVTRVRGFRNQLREDRIELSSIGYEPIELPLLHSAYITPKGSVCLLTRIQTAKPYSATS